MLEPYEFVAAIVASAPNGMIIGRIRMHKIVYFLQKLGYKGADAFAFSNMHYGPYSFDLDSAIVDAKAFNLVKEESHHRRSDGALYSAFMLCDKDKEKISKLPGLFCKHVRDLAKEKATVLELATTIHWLSKVERVADWKDEINRRKTWKVKNGRLEKALNLLDRLDLPNNAS